MKNKALISFAGLIIVVLATTFVLMRRQPAMPVTSTSASPANTATALFVAPTDVVRMNRIVQKDNYSLLVLTVRNHCGLIASATPAQKKQFLSVELIIGNQNAQPLPFALSDVQLIADDDNAYPAVITGCAQELKPQSLAANSLTRGELVFEVPAGIQPKLLRYSAGDAVLIAGLRY